MKYIFFIVIIMILVMLAILLTQSEFGKGLKRMNSGVMDIVDDVSDTADDARSSSWFNPVIS